MVLKTIRWGRLFLFIGGQESQNYTSEVIRLKSTKIRWFSWWPVGKLDQLPGGCSRAVFSQAKAKGIYQAWVYSDQMVLLIVRWEAGPVAWWPKTLKWEMENKSRQPRREGRCWSGWCWWVRTNHTATGPCNSDLGYWGIMALETIKVG
jgi:hypothetical protein